MYIALSATEDGPNQYIIEVSLCNKCFAIITDIQGHLRWHLEKDKRTWGTK